MKCCDLSAGQLRHAISLQSEQESADGAGGHVLLWLTYAGEVMAKLTPVTGVEALHADRLEAAVTHRCWLRFRDDITTKHRVVFEDRTMQIRAVINLEERSRWLELHLEEGVVT